MKHITSIIGFTFACFALIACGVDVKQKLSEVSSPVNAASNQTIVAGTVTLVNGIGEIVNKPVCKPSDTCVWQVTNCGLNKSTTIGLPIVIPDNIDIVDPNYSTPVAYLLSTTGLDQSTYCYSIIKS